MLVQSMYWPFAICISYSFPSISISILIYTYKQGVTNIKLCTVFHIYEGIPVPIVAISVGIVHDHYGTDKL